MKNKFSNIAGTTLVEILIGIVISVLMMAAIFTSYSAVNNTYSQVIDKAKISQTGRDIIGMLIRDIRIAGFKYFDDVSSNELFHKMLRVIVDNPEENFSSWGEGDVFRSKATGFQRLALTREFVSILDQGENAVSRLPINLDASSSIYQHASALMLDADMASKVNVLPNNTGGPVSYTHLTLPTILLV